MSSKDDQALPVGVAWDALARLDADALVAVCDPEIRFRSRITAVEGPAYEGHQGVRRYIANLTDAFERIEAKQFDVVAEHDRAVFNVRFRGRGRGSGVEVEHEYFAAAKGRDGRLLWWAFFDSRAEAAEAVGLTGDLPRPYVLGHSDQELDRLQVQARLIEPITRQFFCDAGLAPGMRVLDIGSGVGDVAFLAAELVGEEGEVVGIDRASQPLAVASARAEARSLSNVSFREGDAAEVTFDGPFDAVVGRYVLMYQPDPVAVLRSVAAHVRFGGVVVFHEPEWACARSIPPVASWDCCCDWVVEAMTANGADMQMGLKLPSTFVAAGLPTPAMRYESVIGAGANSSDQVHFTTDVAVTLLPDIEKLGLVAPGEIDPDTLGDEVIADVAASGAIIVGRSEIGAWSRT
jgi:2-polyprenyl-3-methyl-5-hydroxy-6-metoxy-1,4-benzoquinol methylase/ketosteroid isomerase-like protein